MFTNVFKNSIFRFLSSALISQDILAVFGFTVRKFVMHQGASIVIQVVSIYFAYLAFLTIGIMSLERLVIFIRPNFYMRKLPPSRVKLVVLSLWTFLSALYFFIRFGYCYMRVNNATLLDVITTCNRVSFKMYFVLMFPVIILSIICFIVIVKIIRANPMLSTRSLTEYRATSIVTAYLVVLISTALGYIIITKLNISTVSLRLSTDALNTVCCMLDPCFYVLWYRECRMEMLKIVSCCCPYFNDHIEQMRIKVFSVVTIPNKGADHARVNTAF